MMDQLVARFAAQLREAIKMGDRANIRPHKFDLHHIFVGGMGGSGIGTQFVTEFIRDECKLPVLLAQDYDAPAFLGQHSLAIASSYSGDTEETCHLFDKMLASGAKVVVIAAGGYLLERALEENIDFIQLPADCPSPRACLGFSIVQQLFVLYKLNLISDEKIRQVADASILLENNMEEIKGVAHKIAKFLNTKTPVLYASRKLEAAAIRLRQQINQNAKMLCWHHTIPEMNHNELVGWRKENEELAVLFLRSPDDHPRNQRRIDINKEIIAGYTHSIMDVYAEGKTQIAQSLYFAHLADWTSVYLAEMRGIDPVKIKVVEYLKREMGKAS